MYDRALTAEEKARLDARLERSPEWAHQPGDPPEEPREALAIPVFLRAQASAIDQPNDNGPNACLKACLSEAFAQYQAQFPGQPMTSARMNLVMSRSFESFRLKAAKAIRGGFRRTGIFPFSLEAAKAQVGESQYVELLDPRPLPTAPVGEASAAAGANGDAAASTTAMGALQRLDPRSMREALEPVLTGVLQGVLPKMLKDQGGRWEEPLSPRFEGVLAAVQAGVAEGLIRARITEQAKSSFDISMVRPAQEVQHMIRAEAAAKKKPVAPRDKTPNHGLNPSTRGGMVVNSLSLRNAARTEEVRAGKKQDAALKKIDTAAKHTQKVKEATLVAEPILAELDGRDNAAARGTILQSKSLPDLKSVLTFLKLIYKDATHAKLDLSPSTKSKGECIAAIENAVAAIPCVITRAKTSVDGRGGPA